MEAIESSTEVCEIPSADNKPLFRDLNADETPAEATEIESACMSCFRSGITRLLLTKIPFYKEVVLMSFKCEYCGYENNEIQSASEIQKKGVFITLLVETEKDLNRKIVRSDYACIRIPEVELEIPAQSQKGEITTIEGVIDRTIRGLTQDQVKRKNEHPETAAAIDNYIERLNALKKLEKTFRVIVEDVSGNSFIENPYAPATDHNCTLAHFTRTTSQDKLLGMYNTQETNNDDSEGKSGIQKQLLKPVTEKMWNYEELLGEILQFHTICPECNSACETNMKLTSIPHFKEVVIMSTVCEVCGSRTNEVKSGGGIEEKGVRFEVRIESKEDLNRDILKSETGCLSIPELDFEVGSTALGGRFTTTEGILVAMKSQLQESELIFNDSLDETGKKRMESFLLKFDDIIRLELPVTLIIDDPAGNSYVQSLNDADVPDSKLKVIRYERNNEQNEELGLNDMKTENY